LEGLFIFAMKIITTIAEMKAITKELTCCGKSIGLVPTMGYLHHGHLSLMQASIGQNSCTIVSIFVNPTQFGPREDLATYPQDAAGDEEKCRSVGVNLIFRPSASEIYGSHYQTFVEVNQISNHLCGKSRPGHFRGVATIVLKLFNIISPTRAYFGLKDYQQVQIIRRMVRDFNLDIEIVPCPIVRESDGLAMSSRNAYLNAEDRIHATGLYDSLKTASDLFTAGERRSSHLLDVITTRIERIPDAKPDYIKIVDSQTLEDIEEIGDQALVALAVRIGKTRLIDSIILKNN
jgi:pantoate--beta-alanine ligase